MISVIVPVYKVESYIRRCVDSILAQSYTDFELILVDDGSPDGCGEICDEYAKCDSRIKVIHKENGGLSSARNAALDYVCEEKRAEWISFIDSDDWVHPEYLSVLLSAAEKAGAQIAVSDFIMTDGDAVGDTSDDVYTYSPEEFWVKRRSPIACAKLYKRELFENMRYPLGKLHEDEFLTYKLIFACEKVVYTPSKTYFYYQNQSSIMGSSWTPRRMHGIEAITEQRDFFKENGYKKARQKTECALAQVYTDNICFARTNNKEGKYDKEIESMLSGLRKHLSKNAKHVPMRYSERFYIIAFPEREKSILRKSSRRKKMVAFLKKIAKALRLR